MGKQTLAQTLTYIYESFLLQEILRGAPLIISSDATTNAAKSTCFAWSISSESILWKGAGVACGPVDDVYSGHAEAFGIYSALYFLLHYICNFPVVFPNHSPIKVICDNWGVLQRIEQLKQAFFLSAHMTTMDDFDIFHGIHQTDQQLHPLTFCYEHVLGHQDRHCPFHQLSLEAKLNIECNKRAAMLLPKFLRFCHPVHPCLPSASPSLFIHGNLIVREYQAKLRHAACSPDYRDYLCQKYHWKASDCEEVNWSAFSLAFRKFKASDQTFLQKF